MKLEHTPARSTPVDTAFETRARTLLARYAEGAPAAGETEARVRARLEVVADATSSRAWQWRPRVVATRARIWAGGAVAVGLLVALLVGFASTAALRGLHAGGGGAACSEIAGAGKNGLPSLCPVVGRPTVTLDVLQTYADPTRTAIQYRITLTGALIPHDRPVVYSPPDAIIATDETLRDARGSVYSSGGMGGGSGNSGPGSDTTTTVTEFPPLPQDELGSPQIVTLHIGRLFLTSGDFIGYVTGSWSATVQLTPHAGRSIAFQVAPQTHAGVTVQPLRLDINDSVSPFDAIEMGARLVLRISGLPAETPVDAAASASLEYHLSDGSGMRALGPTQWLLEGQVPAAIATEPPEPPIGATGGRAVVGPSGTLVVDLMFFGPPLAQLTGPQTLSLNQITLAEDATGAATQVAQGPWSFTLPLS